MRSSSNQDELGSYLTDGAAHVERNEGNPPPVSLQICTGTSLYPPLGGRKSATHHRLTFFKQTLRPLVASNSFKALIHLH